MTDSPINTGDPQLNKMIEATVNFTEQLTIMSTALEKISTNSEETNRFLSDKDGLIKLLQDRHAETDTKIEKLRSDLFVRLDFIKSEVHQKVDTTKSETQQKIDSAVKNAVMKINLMYLGSLTIFGFIVYIINLVFSNQLAKEIADLLVRLGK